MGKDWFEMKEAAGYLGVSVETITGWIKGRGKNSFKNYTTKIGQRRIITYENARRFIRGWKPEVDLQEIAHINGQLRSDIDGDSA